MLIGKRYINLIIKSDLFVTGRAVKIGSIETEVDGKFLGKLKVEF